MFFVPASGRATACLEGLPGRTASAEPIVSFVSKACPDGQSLQNQRKCKCLCGSNTDSFSSHSYHFSPMSIHICLVFIFPSSDNHLSMPCVYCSSPCKIFVLFPVPSCHPRPMKNLTLIGCDGAAIPLNHCLREQRFLSIDAPVAITALPVSQLIKVRVVVEYDQ